MKKLWQLKNKATWLLLTGIFVLCAGFIVVGCGIGTGPQMKVEDPNKGAYALDFSNCPGVFCRVLLSSDEFVSTDSKKMAGKELAIEAWVKSKAPNAAAFEGGIFGRLDTAGIALYVKGGVPKVAIRRVGASGAATATSDYIASSNMAAIADSLWHHIAGILTGDDHTGVHDNCDNSTDTVDCTAVECRDGIHLDIYVDGDYKDCNTTHGLNNDTTPSTLFAEEAGDHSLGVGVLSENVDGTLDGLDELDSLPGIVDEPRLWGTNANGKTRSLADILACMNRELDTGSGTCGRGQDALIAYFRFNKGEGDKVAEWSGLGSGILEYSDGSKYHHWTTGWTTDTPGLNTAD